jgi:Spy/CpxP family protein refolding chaperone
LSACGGATTETASDDPTFEAVLETADQGASAAGYLDRAPRGLQLTAEQKAAIRTINERFRTANKADLDALTAITREAMAARRSGASRAEVIAIVERSRAIRERLAPAFAALRAALNAVLTEEQRAWLANNARRLGPDLPPLPGR